MTNDFELLSKLACVVSSLVNLVLKYFACFWQEEYFCFLIIKVWEVHAWSLDTSLLLDMEFANIFHMQEHFIIHLTVFQSAKLLNFHKFKFTRKILMGLCVWHYEIFGAVISYDIFWKSFSLHFVFKLGIYFESIFV